MSQFKDLEEIPEKEILPGLKAKFIHTDNMTIAYWKVDKGAVFPEHTHPHEQFSNIVEGKFEFFIGDETKILEKGIAGLIPANVKHGGKALTDCQIIDIFYPVREDYQK